MANVQMMPPADGRHPTIRVSGRTYTCAVGSVLAVPSFDAHALEANGWLRCSSGEVGTTAQRPTAPKRGTNYLDTTVGGIVIWDGLTWRNALTGASA